MLRALAMNFTARDYEVVQARTGTEALTSAARDRPDLIVLDLGLPDVSGVDVIRGVRAHAETPIIVLSARIGSPDKVQALDLGADDYVTKPFSMQELLARVRAVTRRTEPAVSRQHLSSWERSRSTPRPPPPPAPTANAFISRRPSGIC